MASAFRTQRESLLDWRAEAEPWTLSPIASPAAPDPEAQRDPEQEKRGERVEHARGQGSGKPSAEPIAMLASS